MMGCCLYLVSLVKGLMTVIESLFGSYELVDFIIFEIDVIIVDTLLIKLQG